MSVGLSACVVLALGGAPAGQGATTDEVRLRRVGQVASGAAEAVIVDAGRLVHTALLLPTLDGPRDDSADEVSRQVTDVLAQLETVLRAAGTTMDDIVRLHVYVSDAAVTPVVDRALAQRFAEGHRPALTLVESRPARDGARVAMDAVAATSRAVPRGRPARLVVDGVPSLAGAGAHVAIQPDGPFVVVSGRAAAGGFDEAITGTMNELRADLAGVGLDMSHVVQVKSFLNDMTRADDLQRGVARAFDGTAPPQVVTEWTGASVPAEIELVAVSPAIGAPTTGPEAAVVAFVEPIASRYSRVARVMSGRPVYVSGLSGASADPATQVDEIFAALQRVAASAGSDMRHLVKATYYVSDTAADQRINVVRPSFYASDSPPAASKISVRGLGRPGPGATIDMIMVAGSR